MSEVKFFYLKSPFHQEIKADGAFGGVGPTGDRIAMSVYTERNSIPNVVVQSISDEGVLGDEIVEKREGKDGIVRTVQATIHMDLAQAKAIHEWIGRHIGEIEKLTRKP